MDAAIKPSETRGLRLLVWTPWLNPGGGLRLVRRLVPELAANPRIRKLTWAIGDATMVRRVDVASSPRVSIRVLASARLAHRFRTARPPGGGVGRRARNYLDRLIVGRLLARLSRLELQILAREHDLVYAPWPHRLTCPSLDRPIVCTIQDTILLEFPEILGGPETERESASIAAWLHFCRHVIVSSESTRTALIRLYGAAATNVAVVPHAIVPDDLVNPDQVGASGSDALFPRLPARYIACLTNISSHKNLDTLLIAWSRSSLRGEFVLVLTGTGTETIDETRPWSMNLGYQQDRLTGLMRRLGLRRGVDVTGLGYVRDEVIGPLLGQAWALINPSLSEGGGSYPVEEALSMGVPVLCSDIPVMREHLAHRERAVVWFDPVSVPSIVAALDHLVAQYPAYKAAAAEQARAPRPVWEQVASDYVTVFESAVRKSRCTEAEPRL